MKNTFSGKIGPLGMIVGGLVIGFVGFLPLASAHGGGSGHTGHGGHHGGGLWVCTASDSYTYATGSGPTRESAEAQALSMCQTSATGSQHGGVCRINDCIAPD